MIKLFFHIQSKLKTIVLSVLIFGISASVNAADDSAIEFNDRPLDDALILPDWFKLSFLELKTDIEEAREQNKKGVIIYFGQDFCPYCKAHIEKNWGQKDIIQYTQDHFDVLAINVKGQKPVVDIDGKSYTEKTFSALKQTDFTPSVLFYNNNGQVVLRLRGYRPPYQFRAALEYVADEHYKNEPFREYMARAETALSFGKATLNTNDAFNPPPYLLDRSHFTAERPLMVLFERKRCHSCDILHGGPIANPEIDAQLLKFDVVQLDIYSDVPVLTPNGEKITAKKWAEKLDINYSPTLVFFDQSGKEIIRIDSVVWFYRLRNVMNYVLSGDYKKYPTFQLWRQSKNMR